MPAPHHSALIVDPDRDTRVLHETVLRPLVGRIDHAEDGAEAFARAIGGPPAIIVTEARLPRIDGYELCRMLREEPATRTAVIVMVTASADFERGRQAGADEVLIKPCPPDLIRSAAMRLFGTAIGVAAVAADAGQRTIASGAGRRAGRRALSRIYRREVTATPPAAPPVLRCPDCEGALVYESSVVGGVSPRSPEQWDIFRCERCGVFEYRHRTRKLRRA